MPALCGKRYFFSKIMLSPSIPIFVVLSLRAARWFTTLQVSNASEDFEEIRRRAKRTRKNHL